MKNYELLYILPANITSEETKTAFLEVEKNILKLGGKKLETLLNHPFLVKAETSKEEDVEELKNLPIVKRRLAYPIKKNRVGFYCLFNFSSEANNIKEIDNYLKMNSAILRYLIIQADPITKEGIEQLEKLFARKRAEQEKQERQEKEKREKSKQKEDEEKKEIKRKSVAEERRSEIVSKEKIEDKTGKEIKEEIVEKKAEKKTTKKKIKLEDLEEKLDEILEDTSII